MENSQLNTLKMQFAYELFVQAPRSGLEHESTFAAAKLIARSLYPFGATLGAALRIANEWIKDPIVIDTYLKLKSGEADGRCLPTEAQFVMAICDQLDRIREDISSLKRGSIELRKAKRLRQEFIESSKLFSDQMQFLSGNIDEK